MTLLIVTVSIMLAWTVGVAVLAAHVQRGEVMDPNASLAYVVTFNPVNDFQGLRRMPLAEALNLANYASEWNCRSPRVVNVETMMEEWQR